MIEDKPVGRADIIGQSRAGAVSREGIHFQEIGSRSELRKKVVDKGVVVAGAPQIGRADEESLTGQS